MSITSHQRDWPEDFVYENGNYQCQCIKCGLFFVGYKRRVICKECAKVQLPEIPKEIKP